MLTMDPAPQHVPQQPAQWAVRWFGVVAAALLITSVPLVHVVWHGLLGHDEPMLRTRGQHSQPPATWENVMDGTWMLDEERYLREASPVVWKLRSSWNEARYRIGAPQSEQVWVARDDWFFIMQEVWPDRLAFDAATASRRQFLRDVRERVEKAGARLFVMVVPDKARVYPDIAYPDRVLPPAKGPIYGLVLADLAAAGIETVDLATVMTQARAAALDEELYFRRDTHWRPAGALAGARATAAAIEGGPLGALLSPRRQMELGGMEAIRLVGDLTAMLGLGTIEVPDEIGMRTVPLTFLTERLAETRQYYGVVERDGQRSIPVHGNDPDAEILLLGTSFSEENGLRALSLCLGRRVRGIVTRGADGMESLREALPEFAGGTKAKVVIWELVERAFLDPPWRNPKL